MGRGLLHWCCRPVDLNSSQPGAWVVAAGALVGADAMGALSVGRLAFPLGAHALTSVAIVMNAPAMMLSRFCFSSFLLESSCPVQIELEEGRRSG